MRARKTTLIIIFTLLASTFFFQGASAGSAPYDFGHLPLVLETGDFVHRLELDGTKMGDVVYTVEGPGLSFTTRLEAEFPAIAALGPRSIVAGAKFGVLRLYVFDGRGISSRILDDAASDPAVVVRGGYPVLVYRSTLTGVIHYAKLDWNGRVLDTGILGHEPGPVSRPKLLNGRILFSRAVDGGILERLYDYPAGLVDERLRTRGAASGHAAPNNGIADWTFMVYLDGDNNLDSYGYSDIQEMVSGYQDGAEPHVHVIVLYDKSSSGDSHLYNVTDDGTEEISGDADWWPANGEVNMGDPQTLVNFVVWTIQNYPARHYALDLWDHGGDYSGCCWDDTDGDHLTIEELRDALQDIYDATGVMLDFYGYDACIMGYVGIHYQTKDFVLFSAGSQDTEGADGWDYNALISGLTSDPSMDAEDWASYFIQHVDDEHNGGSIDTMGITNTSRFEYLANAVNWLAQKLRHIAGSQHSSIQQAFSDAHYIYSGYDLGSLADAIVQDVDDSDAQQAAGLVSGFLQYSFMVWHAPGMQHTGVGIMGSTSAYSGHTSIPFITEINWYNFLQNYEQSQDAPNTEPQVEITYPSEGDVFQQGSTINVQGTASDDESVTLVQVKVDTKPWQDATGTDSWSFQIDTSGLSVGQHTIWARSYDGFDYSYFAWVNVTVALNTNLPDLAVDPDNVSFSPSDPEEGDTVTVTALIQNVGNVDSPGFEVSLLLDGVEVDRTGVDPIPVGGSRTVQLSFDTTGHVGQHTIGVMLDPDDEVQELSESNNRADVPIVINGYQPAIEAQLDEEFGWPNGTVTVPFLVRNNGTYADTFTFEGNCGWQFSIRVPSLTLGPGEEAFVLVDVDVPAGGGTTSITLTVHSQGSGKTDSASVSLSSSYLEDAFGYRMAYSYYPDLGSLQWQDLGLGDDDYVYLSLPFDFPFYGQPLDGVYVSSNGFVSTGGHSYPDNHGLPYGSDSLIAPFWDDLDPSQGSVSVAYPSLGGLDAVAIRWQAPPKGSSDPVTVYLILTENGRILFLYEDTYSGDDHDMGGSATAGIQYGDGSGNMYIEFSHNSRVLASYSCVEASMRPGAPSNPIIEGPGSASAYEAVEFTFRSMDPEGDQVRFHVDWGDGTQQVTDFVDSEAVLEHHFLEIGTLTITAYAEDPEGHQSGVASFTVVVSTRPRVDILVPGNNSEVSGIIYVRGSALEPATGHLTQVWMQEFGAARYEGPQVVGDVDGDGLNEALMGGRDAQLRVYRWQNGTFELLATIESGYGDNPGGFAIGDVDGDGENEIAVAWDYHFQIWEWRNGTFVQLGDTWDGDGTDDTYDVFLGDVDMDGRVEMILADHPHSGGPEITVLKWVDGEIREIASWNMPGGDFMTPMAWVADVDDDGVNEIVATPGNDVVVLELTGGSFQWDYVAQDLPDLAYGCVAEDSDMDGVPEIHVGLDSPDAYIFGWNGTGYELEAHFHWDGEGVVIEGVSVGDVDGDGVPEVLFGTDLVHVIRWFGGGYAEVMEFGQGGIGDIAPLNVGDFDNDLHGEILVGNVISDPQGRYTMRLLEYEDSIQKVEVRVDDGSWKRAQGTNAWSYLLNTFDLPNGPHVIRARSYDGSRYSQYDIVTIVVNNTPDEEPPSVQIVEPTEGAFVNSSTVTVRWTGSDNVGIEYYEISVDSLPFSNVGQANEYTIEDLGEGGHTVRIRAHDYAGNTAVAWVNFTVDTLPPELEILSPHEDQLVPGPDVTVRWEVSDENGVSEIWLSLDGTSWIRVSGDSYTLGDLEDGEHVVTLRACDPAGNWVEDSVTFTVDSTPPEVRILNPSDGAVLGDVFIVVDWEGGDSVALDHFELSVDGGQWIDVGLDTEARIQVSGEGTHTVSVKAVDEVGHSSVDQVSFEVDLTPPSLEVLQPREDEVLDSTTVVVKWRVQDAHLSVVALSLDGGEEIPVQGGEYVFHDVSPGNHTLRVRAADVVGHETSVVVHFTVDPTIPWVRILTPVEGEILGSSDVEVRWEANFAYMDHMEVYVDGEGPNVVHGNGTVIQGLADGEHVIEVVEVGLDGRTASDTVTFTVDANPPTVVILQPGDDSYLNGSVILSWRVEDATLNATFLSVDGSAWRPVPSEGTMQLDLEEGDHLISIRALDALGRVSEESVTVHVDLTAPVIEVATPEAGSLYGPNVSFSWSVSDNMRLQNVYFRVDGGEWESIGPEGTMVLHVTSSGTHRIAVLATDAAGNTDVVEIEFVVDADPPVIRVLQPVLGSYVNSSDVTVIIEVVEEHRYSISYYIDGEGPYEVGYGRWMLRDLTDGAHELRILVRDEVGNSGEAVVDFVVDTTPPRILEISVPTIANSASVEVSVYYEEENPSKVLYRVDGGAWVEAPSDVFTVTVEESGAHSIEVMVVDRAGNSDSALASFVVDLEPPTLDAEPTEEIFASGHVTIRVTAADDYSLSEAYLRFGDARVVRKVTGSSYSGILGINIPYGVHTVTVGVRDEAGNVVEVAVRVTVDTEPPEITVTGVTDGGRYGSPVTVDVAVEDLTGASLTVFLDGAEARVPLRVEDEGWHTLVVTARDAVGHSSSAVLHFMLDMSGPAISARILELEKGNVVIGVSATDPSGISAIYYRVDGGQWVALSGNTLSLDLGYGNHTIELRGIDSLGNEATVILTVVIPRPLYLYAVAALVAIVIILVAITRIRG